jgi:hypothetical protein
LNSNMFLYYNICVSLLVCKYGSTDKKSLRRDCLGDRTPATVAQIGPDFGLV